jgi:Type I phosphodiesterase / nucleotide pyrophosphatase/RTX calcium-binding nonapeptide repeat (4 copies)
MRIRPVGRVTLGLVVVALVAPSVEAGPPPCRGEAPTIVGTAGADELTGTRGRDVIAGLGGDDVIRALGGADLVCGGQGSDVLVGGGGSDDLVGGKGHDVLRGGGGNDSLRAGLGIDACYQGKGGGSATSCSDVAAAACGLPAPFLRRIERGVHGSRTGDLQIVPKAPDFVGPGFTHSGPWGYLQDVPLLLYGPGYVEPNGPVDRPVTAAAIAPTIADLLGFPFQGASGPLSEALVPAADRPEPPALVVTVVWDGAGRVVLDTWPGQWPNLKGLISQGTWYEHATVGSSPSNTPPIHATIGTGVFADEHGMTDIVIQLGASLKPPWQDGPQRLKAPSLADVYDPSEGNAPIVAGVATEPSHLGMLGQGTLRPGGDADVAVLDKGQGGNRWGLPGSLDPHYRFPGYVNDVTGLPQAVDELDVMDGKDDGKWRDNDIASLDRGFDTPARIPYQTKVVREIIRQEGMGQGGPTDLLYVNHKMVDLVGHRWSLNSPEMKDTLQLQDADLPVLIDMLDQEVGAGRWVLALTADHGVTPKPSVSGAEVVSRVLVRKALTERFDPPGGPGLVLGVRPTQVFLDPKERKSVSLVSMSRFLLDLRKGDAAIPPVPPGARGQRAFAAAFPTAWIHLLGCVPSD